MEYTVVSRFLLNPSVWPILLTIENGSCNGKRSSLRRIHKKGENSMPVYNKLVRDRIPEIIKKSGKVYRSRVLKEEEYISELRKKAQEELNEYITSHTNKEAIEELTDLLEVVHALAVAHGSSIEQLEEVRKMKAEKRGGFQERIFLIDVEDE